MPAAEHTFTGATSDLIIAADPNRDHITIQLHTVNTPIFLGFGEAAIADTGICLFYPGCSVRVIGAKARLAVYGIDASSSAVVGIETTEDIEYRPGSYSYGY